MTMKGDTIFKEKLTGGLKNETQNLINFHASSCKSENLHFDGLLFSIQYKVSAKRYRRVTSHDARVIQTWRKADFLFEKWHEELGES